MDGLNDEIHAAHLVLARSTVNLATMVQPFSWCLLQKSRPRVRAAGVGWEKQKTTAEQEKTTKKNQKQSQSQTAKGINNEMHIH